MRYGFRNVRDGGYVILEDGHTMFQEDVIKRLRRLNHLEHERLSNVPQGQANGRERSAYVQLPDVRALIEKIEEVQEIMDTAELSLISASSLDKMVEMVRIKNDLKQKLSEHFG